MIEQVLYRGSTSNGKILFLLGTSEDGPVFEPTLIKSIRMATKIFGSAERGTLVKAAEILANNPNIELHLVRISGESASYDLYAFVGEDFKHVFTLRSYYAGAIYNDVVITMDEIGLKITLPLGQGGSSFLYEWAKHNDLGMLAKAINSDCLADRHRVYATTDSPLLNSDIILGPNSMEFNLEGGDGQFVLTKNELYVQLGKAYEILEGLSIDTIVPLGAYLDDAYTPSMYGEGQYSEATYSPSGDSLMLADEITGRTVTYHGQLIDFCEKQTQSSCFTHGVIGLRPVTESQRVNIDKYIEASCLFDRYDIMNIRNGIVNDRGSFISVVMNQEGDAATLLYAGLLTQTLPGVSTTNKSLPIILKHKFNNEELVRLAQLGVVAFRQSARHGVVVNCGVTAALSSSELHFVANVRATNYALNALTASLRDLFGEPVPEIVRRDKVEDRMRAVLDEIVAQGILRDYSYNIDLNQRLEFGSLNLTLQGNHTTESITLAADIKQRS